MPERYDAGRLGEWESNLQNVLDNYVTLPQLLQSWLTRAEVVAALIVATAIYRSAKVIAHTLQREER